MSEIVHFFWNFADIFGIMVYRKNAWKISLQSKRKEGLKDMNKPLLSISMLVSNGRKDTIQRCMESLAQLRNSVSCELVLVDTGCMDGSIDVAKKYADKVLNFVWCNDFSAARNVGLKACTGEWFLYLDDDEWFEDTRELEDFFISGRYKNYEAAWYIQRNYDNLQGTAYTDCYVSRMCRRTSETRFCGRIHEWLEPLSNKIAMLGSYVHHYGYVYSSEEERQKHLLRNLTLEETAVAERPDDIRMCCQLVQEYRAANRYAEAEALCRKTLQTSKYGTKNAFTQYLLTCLPRIYAEQGKNEEAYEELERLEQEEPLASYAKVLCAYEKIIVAGRLRRDDMLLQSAEEYLDRMEQYSPKDGEHPVMDFAAYTSELLYQRAVEYGIKAMFRLGKFEKASFFFGRIDWKREKNPRSEYIKLLLLAYQETGDVQLLMQSAEAIAKVSELRTEWINELERFLCAYSGENQQTPGITDQEEFKRKGRQYTQLAKEAPVLIPIIRIWLKEAELKLLSDQMRSLIQKQIQEGSFSEAAKLLSEVESMMPGEQWIVDLKCSLSGK